jgi:hypothetical protein
MKNQFQFFSQRTYLDFADVLTYKKYVFRYNHADGRVFSLQMGKNRLFQESFQKNPLELTPILYMESNRHYVEKLCAKGEK